MAKFLEFGEAECICSDNNTRQVAISISVPWCIVQAAIPLLLAHGFIDRFQVKYPLISWTPPLLRERFLDHAVSHAPNIAEKATSIIQNHVMEALQIFSDLSSMLKNPDDAIGILPMGVYVEFQYRSTYEEFATVIEKLEPLGTPGVTEFRHALAIVLVELLSNAGDVCSFESHGKRIPPVLGIPATSNLTELALSAHPTERDNSPRND
jgi:hypothetical protein